MLNILGKSNINSFDSDGKKHGYQEWYWSNGQIWYRCVMKHNLEFGYEEWHNNKETNFYIR